MVVTVLMFVYGSECLRSKVSLRVAAVRSTLSHGDHGNYAYLSSSLLLVVVEVLSLLLLSLLLVVLVLFVVFGWESVVLWQVRGGNSIIFVTAELSLDYHIVLYCIVLYCIVLY